MDAFGTKSNSYVSKKDPFRYFLIDMTNDPILQVKGLTTRIQIGKKGGANVVSDVSFDLYPGKTLAIVGESGSGKSMTALSILRILPEPPALPSEGEVLFQGKNLLDFSESEMRKIRGHRIAMIFQDPMSALNPVYTIGDQLGEVAELHLGLYGEDGLQRVIQVLEDVGIPSPELRIDEYPHQLSGGMKQRVMIAMALMCEPDILIADEPTTALDVTIQMQVLNLMRDLQKKKGMAILLITHDMGVVAEMADDVLVMYATRIVESGEVNAIFDDMAHPYTKGLFHSRPHIDSEKGALYTIKGMVPPISNLPKGCPFHPRCPHVMEKCRSGEIPSFPLEATGHVAECWLYERKEVLHDS
jgi:peptide/nickel transport system ATP-binding protein